MTIIRTAIPNKGRLAEDAAGLLRAIGLRIPGANDRKLLVESGKGRYQVLFASPWDIPRYVESGAADVGIVEVRGAAELTPSIGAADFLVDLVETGSTLRMNHLKVLDVILESRAVLVASPRSLDEKSAEIREFASAIQSVVEAESRRYLMANVPPRPARRSRGAAG